jgi:ADP-ribose pyrophosphatase YjhB (NUDIX family)
MEPNWLSWAKKLQAIAQNGLTYTQNHFDIERFEQIRQISAEIMASYAGVDTEKFLTIFMRENGYATPKVDTRGVVFKDDKILLVKEVSDGKWAIPGGWADLGFPPSKNVEREVLEESGFIVKAKKLAAVFDRSCHPHEPLIHFHIYKMFFICDLIGGHAQKSSETDEIEFFTEQQIPDLSLTKVTFQQVKRMFEHHKNPLLPPDFD